MLDLSHEPSVLTFPRRVPLRYSAGSGSNSYFLIPPLSPEKPSLGKGAGNHYAWWTTLSSCSQEVLVPKGYMPCNPTGLSHFCNEHGLTEVMGLLPGWVYVQIFSSLRRVYQSMWLQDA